MSITVYATITDLQNVGLPPGALANVSAASQQEALQNASSMMDDHFQSQYTLPFLTISYSLTQYCCLIAAYLIMQGKGFNPSDASDQSVRQGYLDAMAWLDGVARRRIHPAVTDSATPANIAPGPRVYAAPSQWDFL